MKRFLIILGLMLNSQLLIVSSALAQRHNVPLDSIRLSDPAVLADEATHMYYMTGTGGMMWKSRDLKLWDGPFRVPHFFPVDLSGDKLRLITE